MADIIQAIRNYHEYQIIMSILWKRLNDTGKNWRHIYKALTVLEYLIGHGSERVIDDLREHMYQISALKEFQHIDSHGRDQGQNARKKSHAVVTLLNDKERIREAREKAAVNRESASSTGDPYRPGYGGDNFEEDRYATPRDDDRNDYGREVERYRDDDRNGRNGDSATGREDAPCYSYGKDNGECYGCDEDNYRDEDVGGDRDNEDGRDARKTEKKRDQNYDDYERGSRASDYSPQHDKYGQKQLGGNSGSPPSYEEALSDSSNNTNDRKKELSNYSRFWSCFTSIIAINSKSFYINLLKQLSGIFTSRRKVQHHCEYTVAERCNLFLVLMLCDKPRRLG